MMFVFIPSLQKEEISCFKFARPSVRSFFRPNKISLSHSSQELLINIWCATWLNVWCLPIAHIYNINSFSQIWFIVLTLIIEYESFPLNFSQTEYIHLNFCLLSHTVSANFTPIQHLHVLSFYRLD